MYRIRLQIYFRARPGARRETLNIYKSSEYSWKIFTNHLKGVDKSFAIQAGKRIRVMVIPEHVMMQIWFSCTDIAKQLKQNWNILVRSKSM